MTAMRIMHSCMLILVATFFAANITFAQVARQWVARFPSSVKGATGGVTAMTTDGSGNVYVAGWTTRKITKTDIVVIKYTPDGQMLWSAYYDGGMGNKSDIATAVAVDSAQNVYVTGTSDGGTGTGLDYITIKYNKTGDTVRWANRFDGTAHGEDKPVAIAVNDSFIVYVTGMCTNTGTGQDFLTVKYNANGDTVWTRLFDGPAHGADYPSALAVRAYTDLYVTGASTDTTLDYYTIKYNAITGDTIWTARYNGLGKGDDVSRAIALRSSSEVYITGSTRDSVNGYDYTTIKYNAADGVVDWTSNYNGSANGDDIAYALAVYSTSRIYVTGRSLGFSSFDDAVTVAYGQSGGSTLWESRYNGGGNDEDYGVGVTAENNPTVLAAVSNFGIGKDMTLLRLKGSGGGSGSVQWEVRYNGPGNYDDIPKVILGTGSTYYVGGSSDNIKTSDVLSIKYVDQNNLKYRTFVQDSLGGKSASLQTLIPVPTIANVRDTAFARAYPKIKKGYPGYPGGLVVGNARPDAAKLYGWIRITKGAAIASLLPDTGTARGLDVYAGKPFIGEKKDPSKTKFNNRLVGDLVALRINIGASDAEVTPPTLGDVTYELSDTLNGIPLKGKSLREIASLADNFLTYYQQYPSVNWVQLDTILMNINGAFMAPVTFVSKQPLVATGAIHIDSVLFLKPGIAPLMDPLAFPKGSLEELPATYTLYQNYPNPFNPSTTLSFDLPQASVVTLTMYDILGREVAVVLDHVAAEQGKQEVVFDGSALASGVYFYRLVAEDVSDGTTFISPTQKMVLVK